MNRGSLQSLHSRIQVILTSTEFVPPTVVLVHAAVVDLTTDMVVLAEVSNEDQPRIVPIDEAHLHEGELDSAGILQDVVLPVDVPQDIHQELRVAMTVRTVVPRMDGFSVQPTTKGVTIVTIWDTLSTVAE